MAVKKGSLTATVHAKNGRLYAVIQYKEDGRFKTAWRKLDLDEGASQSKINKAYREVVGAFETQLEEARENACRLEAEACVPVYEYMTEYLEKAKGDYQLNTYRGYKAMTEGRIREYFSPHPELTVGSLQPKDIESFYQFLLGAGQSPNTVNHFHMYLHKAFRQAFKKGLIDINPFDRAERPKKEKFQGDHYSKEELSTLLALAKEDPIYPAILLAGVMGLRRSEALGVRWSRIDAEKHTVLLDTKIAEYDENGKLEVIPVEEMKNASSCRTIHIPDEVWGALLEVKARQETNRKAFKGCYNREYDDYVCTDALGNLMRPNYITQHFGVFLEQNGLRKIRFHDLRHTCASLLLSNNIPLINVSRLLGHSTISTTANIYGHLDQTSMLETSEAMSAILKSAK